MSLSFDPDKTLDATWAAVLLSERDVAGQIPINFVTTSAVSLRAACFDDVFDVRTAQKCISNLLVMGYRRLIIDLYWSSERRAWTFCPATFPQSAHIVTVSSTPSATPAATATASADTATPTITAVHADSGSLLYQLGAYYCADGLDLQALIDVMLDEFKHTTSQINVYTRYLSFNIHAATNAAAADLPASKLTGSELPTASEHIGSLLDARLVEYIYGPPQLEAERKNLNNSWYEVEDGYKPITDYFTTIENHDGTQRTPDGWPCVKYVQLARERRLLLEYGVIDPQMEDYNLMEDDSILFPPGYLTSTVPVSPTEGGGLSGCLYEPEATAVSQANSSWAIANSIPISSSSNEDIDLGQLSNTIQNLTACGLTPALNTSLFNSTADLSPEAYQNVSLSASWAWAIGEPKGSAVTDNIDEPKRDRCAVMDLSEYGHWRVVNCTETRHAACRVGHLPFTWSLSPTVHDYQGAYSRACDGNASLGVPRTALENTYLYRYLMSQSNTLLDAGSPDPMMREIWLDFNSLDISSCWVTGGPEASCPYASDPEQLEKRTVLVAAVAGIVILVIAALTLFVKCNANRRNSRRRKRIIQGWEYEGVPS